MSDITSPRRPAGRPRGAVAPKDKYYHYLLRLPPEMAAEIQARADLNFRDFRRQIMLLIQSGLDASDPPERVPPPRATPTRHAPEGSGGGTNGSDHA